MQTIPDTPPRRSWFAYAIHLPLGDMLMETFKRRPPNVWPEEHGVMKLETVPRGTWARTRMPMGSQKTFANHAGAVEG